MSFRGRLLVFFTIIVVVPMIAVALVLFSLTADSEHGKVDARLAGGLRTALGFYEEARLEARGALRRIAADDQLRASLRLGDKRATAQRLRELVAAEKGIESAAYFKPDGWLGVATASSLPVAAAGATPIRGAREPAADSGDVELAGHAYRARVEELREPAGPPTQVHVLEAASDM